MFKVKQFIITSIYFISISLSYFSSTFLTYPQLESVEKTRLSLDQQTEEVRSAIEEKLKTATAQRDENMKKMVDRLKDHVSISFLKKFNMLKEYI